jgi:hypothetical protein
VNRVETAILIILAVLVMLAIAFLFFVFLTGDDRRTGDVRRR